MKKWIAPAVAELSIEETANGCLPFLVESWLTDNVLDNTCPNPNPEDGKGESSTPENSFS